MIAQHSDCDEKKTILELIVLSKNVATALA